MIKYGVWWLGDDNQVEGVCYQGRSVFLADTALEAIIYKEELESYNAWNKGKYKIYKLEID